MHVNGISLNDWGLTIIIQIFNTWNCNCSTLILESVSADVTHASIKYFIQLCNFNFIDVGVFSHTIDRQIREKDEKCESNGKENPSEVGETLQDYHHRGPRISENFPAVQPFESTDIDTVTAQQNRAPNHAPRPASSVSASDSGMNLCHRKKAD